jgi:hypothetical protein
MRSAVFAACLSLAGAGLVGCESETEIADRGVDARVIKADEFRGELERKGQPREGDSNVLGQLEQNIADTNVSPGSKAYAHRLVAQAKVEAAQALMRNVDSKEVQIARLVGDINELNAEVQANNLLVAGLRQQASTAAGARTKVLDKHQQEIKAGAAKGAWKPGTGDKSAPVPSLNAVNERIANLQRQIAGLEAKQSQLKKQRADFARNADRASRASERAKGRDSVKMYTEGAGLRKQASMTATQIDALETQLVPLRQDLALANQQKKQLAAALAVFEQREQTNVAREKEIASLIEGRQNVAEELVHGGADGGGGDATEAPEPRAPRGGTTTPPAGGDTEPEEPAADPSDAEGDADATPAAASEPAAGADADADTGGDAGADAEAATAAGAEGAGESEDAGTAVAPGTRAPAATPPAARGSGARAPAAAAESEDTGESESDDTESAGTGADVKPLDAEKSIAEKAAKIVKLAQEAEADRAEAVKLYESAYDHFKTAAEQAAVVLREVEEKRKNSAYAKQPQREAWDALAETLAPGAYEIPLADTKLALSAIYHDQADSLAIRHELLEGRKATRGGSTVQLAGLKATLEAAKIKMPDTLAGEENDKLADRVKEARDKANQSYKEAVAHLETAIGAPATTQAARDASRLAYVRNVAAALAQGNALRQAGDLSAGGDLVSTARTWADRTEMDNGTQLVRGDYPPALRKALGWPEIRVAAEESPTTGESGAEGEGGGDTGGTGAGSDVFGETGEAGGGGGTDGGGGGGGAGQ